MGRFVQLLVHWSGTGRSVEVVSVVSINAFKVKLQLVILVLFCSRIRSCAKQLLFQCVLSLSVRLFGLCFSGNHARTISSQQVGSIFSAFKAIEWSVSTFDDWFIRLIFVLILTRMNPMSFLLIFILQSNAVRRSLRQTFLTGRKTTEYRTYPWSRRSSPHFGILCFFNTYALS